jgi:very-short-patch-repair endonuclease
MWNVLRREPFAGYHVRRQVPLGPFCADFASHDVNLVIEIDGAQHFDDDAQRRDISREAYISSEGYSVVRFTTSEVLNHLDGVTTALLARLPRKNA